MQSVLSGHKSRKLINIVTAFLLAITSALAIMQYAPIASANGSPGAWQESDAAVPEIVTGAAVVEYEDHVFIIGGNNSGNPLSSVYSAALNPDGSVGEWTELPETLPFPVTHGQAIVHEGLVYLLGGATNEVGPVSTILVAGLNSDGTTSEWSESEDTLPTSLYLHKAFVYGDFVYVVGGSDDDEDYSTVYYAELDGEGGIGAWEESEYETPDTLIYHGAALSDDGVIYLVGGSGSFSDSDAVYYTVIQEDGSIGEWQTSSHALPAELRDLTAVYANGHLYVLGGNFETHNLSTVLYAKVFSDGSTGPWQEADEALPYNLGQLAALAHNGYLYTFNGNEEYEEGSFVDVDYVLYAQLSTENVDGDADGVKDDVENGAPNDGDGNSDGIPDSEQLEVSSFVNQVTGEYVTVELNDNCVLTGVSAEAESTGAKDAGYDYKTGLVNFSAECSEGGAVVTLYLYNVEEEDLTVRKYNPSTNAYFTIEDATVDWQTVEDINVAIVSYEVEDNGALDLNPAVGQITDPVGLASLVVGVPNTGLGAR